MIAHLLTVFCFKYKHKNNNINLCFFQRGEFRQATEDRHTHLYQNPWYVHCPSFLINNISDRNLRIIDELIRLFSGNPSILLLVFYNCFVFHRYAGPNDKITMDTGKFGLQFNVLAIL